MRVDFQPSRKNLHAAPVGLPVEILERVNQAVRVHHNRLRTRLNLHPTMSSGSPCVIARRASSARPAWKNVPLKNRIPISVLTNAWKWPLRIVAGHQSSWSPTFGKRWLAPISFDVGAVCELEEGSSARQRERRKQRARLPR